MKLIDYIKGRRHGREAQGIELDAMRDPLLGEALDGFDAVPGDHSAALERLSEMIGKSAAGGRAASRARASRLRERRTRGWSVAAAAVFVAGIVGGGVWLLRDGLPFGDATRGGVARTRDRNMYAETEEVAILPPVTVITEEGEIPATDISGVELDRGEIREFPGSIAAEPVKGESAASGIHTPVPARRERPLAQSETPISEAIAAADASSSAEDTVVSAFGAQRKDTAESVSSSGAQSSTEKMADAAIIPDSDTSQQPALVTTEFQNFVRESRTAAKGWARIAFKVDADGRPRDITVVESSSPSAARTARRLLRKGPDWPTEPSGKYITVNL